MDRFHQVFRRCLKHRHCHHQDLHCLLGHLRRYLQTHPHRAGIHHLRLEYRLRRCQDLRDQFLLQLLHHH